MCVCVCVYFVADKLNGKAGICHLCSDDLISAKRAGNSISVFLSLYVYIYIYLYLSFSLAPSFLMRTFAVEKYQDMDVTFSTQRECKLLLKLIDTVEAFDADALTAAVR